MVCTSSFISLVLWKTDLRDSNPSHIVSNGSPWHLSMSQTLQTIKFNCAAMSMHCRRIVIYPRGYGEGKGNSISVFLCVDESTLPPDTRVFVKFILRVIDQNQTKAAHFEFKSKIMQLFVMST